MLIRIKKRNTIVFFMKQVCVCVCQFYIKEIFNFLNQCFFFKYFQNRGFVKADSLRIIWKKLTEYIYK